MCPISNQNRCASVQAISLIQARWVNMCLKLERMHFKYIVALSAGIIAMPVTSHWNADKTNTKITFSVKGPFGTVHGHFSGLKSSIQFNEKDLKSSSIEADIPANTVSTGIGLRNSDLKRKKEWLDTEKYPQISFQSKQITKTAAGYLAQGELTLKGVKKPAVISFTFTNQGKNATFKGRFTLKRQDFNVGPAGGSVGSIVSINIEVPVHQ